MMAFDFMTLAQQCASGFAGNNGGDRAHRVLV